MPPTRRAVWRLVVAGAALLTLGSVLGLFLEWHGIRRLAASMNWSLIPAALASTALAYAAVSWAFTLVSERVGIHLPRRTLFAIGFLSIALGQFVALGGVTGFAVRLAFMREHGSLPSDVLAVTLLQASLSNLVLLALLPVGLGYLLLHHPVSGAAAAAIAVAAGILLGLVALVTAALLVGSVRRPVVHAVGGGWRRLTGREGLTPVLNDLDAGLTRALAPGPARPFPMALPLGLIIADWALAALTLGLCFDAVGHPVPVPVVLAGLAIGVAAGLVSMLPGGLGIQDASMAGISVLFGVPVQQAMLVSILFRLVYSAFPVAASLALYSHLRPASVARPLS